MGLCSIGPANKVAAVRVFATKERKEEGRKAALPVAGVFLDSVGASILSRVNTFNHPTPSILARRYLYLGC